ncbi:hypothetical protein L484_022659 [Morus notabilis]|uniref:Pentatricopeptide repeat-containing protein n=1 Tax=Morus notabilis TaxID=981085 RepID=W9R5Q6_9ROSA|nr:pentatricopeptide repeat-containing protein At2g13600 [Morus notabilis]EXB57553.1 hypothetical protein L484_022659 [Morus notabilis]
MLLRFPPNPKNKPFLSSPSLFKLFVHTSKITPSSSPTHLNNLLNNTIQTKNLKHASEIHAQLITNGYISLPFLFNNLLNSYAQCGHIRRSLLLFSAARGIPKNVVAWTTLVTRLYHSHEPFEALSLFSQMISSAHVLPNHFTFSAALPACADTEIAVHGEQLHSLIWKLGFETHVFVCSALLDMYGKCGDVISARKVFDKMPERNRVSWNTMIVRLLRNGFYERAVEFFMEFSRESSVCPDQVSFSSVLSACANIGAVEFGRQVHGVILKHGLEMLVYVENSLMDMYLKCGLFDHALKLFRIMGDADRDIVTWNIMINGCVTNRNFENACNYFWAMRREGIRPDEASYSSVLGASACLAALDQGTMIHEQIIKSGFMRILCVANSLIKMYSRCGNLNDAYCVFEENEDRNVVCWTAMIAAYQQHGCANQVFESFRAMLGDGIKPNYITFVSVLSACSHAGLVEEGFEYFNSMTEMHGIIPGHEHYACMVDLLSRAGRLDEARRFIESMPIRPNSSSWGALLGACKDHNNLEMGRQVAEKLFCLEPNNPGNYVQLCNMYTNNGRLKEADDVRRLMGLNRVRKEPGCSWIDIKNKTIVFTAHDKSHSRTDEISRY